MNNVIVRAISGAVYVALIVGAIFAGPVFFILLTLLFACLGIIEFSQMAHGQELASRKSTTIFIIDILGAGLVASIPAITMPIGYGMASALSIIGLYLLSRATISLYDTRSTAYREVAKSVLGVIYLGMPLLMLNSLYVSDTANTRWIVLMMFVMIWLNDTGAFCFGSLFGKKKLFERLSPKKSWEGFWGGMLCCIICGGICGLTFDIPNFGLWPWIILSVLVSVFSTWGDLFESMLKRTVKVKDSGKLIPGHGGILDRIDSLLFVAPVTYIVYFIANIL